MKILIIYTIIPLLLLAASCKKSNPVTYGEPAMIYIYKDGFNSNRDSIISSFAIKSDALLVDTVKVPVRIMGEASGEAREVKLAPVASLSTAMEGVHYQLLPYNIPSGSFEANLPVVVKRAPELKNTEFRLVLEVQESKDFRPGAIAVANSSIPGAGLRFLIKINDFITKPTNWDSFIIYYFGTYSAAKYKFMIKTTGLTEYKSPDMSGSEAGYLNQLCKTAQAAYEASNGPLLDEFGNRVTFL